MSATFVLTGAREAIATLVAIAGRLGDATPVFAGAITDDVLDAQRDWWATFGDGTWGRTTDKHLVGRNPVYMTETGSLKNSSTQRGAMRQTIAPMAHSLLFDVTSGLAKIHAARGRDVITAPENIDMDRVGEHLADYFLTGNA